MKKLLFILFVLPFTLQAQPILYHNMDTTINKWDTVISPKMAILITPVVINFQGDSAFSLSWRIDGVTRDTTNGANGTVSLYGKTGRSLIQFSVNIPKEIINNWGTDPATIDNFIFSIPESKRFRKRL